MDQPVLKTALTNCRRNVFLTLAPWLIARYPPTSEMTSFGAPRFHFRVKYSKIWAGSSSTLMIINCKIEKGNQIKIILNS